MIIVNRSDVWKIIEHHGPDKQMLKSAEECAELAQACIKVGLGSKKKKDIDNLVEEIADVTLMIEQLKMIMDIDENAVEDIVYEKIARQLKRIRGEKD